MPLGVSWGGGDAVDALGLSLLPEREFQEEGRGTKNGHKASTRL